MKRCRDCGKRKSLDEFYRHPEMTDGRLNSCKDCRRAYTRQWAKRADRQAKDKERKATPEYKAWAKQYQARVRWRYRDGKADASRRRRLRERGLTEEQLLDLMEAQGFACAICEKPLSREIYGPTSLVSRHIDHDHATGAVRGVLCQTCNRMLGMAYDRPDVLRRAASYLLRPPAKKVLAKKR